MEKGDTVNTFSDLRGTQHGEFLKSALKVVNSVKRGKIPIKMTYNSTGNEDL